MALKCGNCKYFVKAHWFGSYCDYKRRMKYRNDCASENNLACNFFQPIGDYNDELANNGTTSDCFLTSACVEYLGKSDNCEELTTLRAFRDNYMTTVPNGKELIKEYYAVAPKVVKRINQSAEKNKYYGYIYEVINNCINLINCDKKQDALNEYIVMVKELSSKLLGN